MAENNTPLTKADMKDAVNELTAAMNNLALQVKLHRDELEALKDMRAGKTPDTPGQG